VCRLFGLTAGRSRVRATFWLLDAPDSLEVQGYRNVDGSGIGFFDSAGAPVRDKQPEPSFEDEEFIHEAKAAEPAAFVAHVRRASTGGRTVRDTHPFAMHGRIMAHNGGFGELARLDEQLGPYASLVLGDTDSERYFALITQQSDAHGGDVGAGAVGLPFVQRGYGGAGLERLLVGRRQPTAPSICSSISRFSSSAYSIGSSRAMGSTNPRTMVAAASSSVMPRLMR
jgi:glutamine phosphoribosylpyrophosphate amidotransferase